MYDGLVVLLIRHGLAGAAAGWATAGLLLWTDTAGIGLLVATSDLWPIPLIMLVWSFGLTFGSVAMGAAIMGLGRRAAHDPSGGARANGRRFDARSRLGSWVADAPQRGLRRRAAVRILCRVVGEPELRSARQRWMGRDPEGRAMSHHGQRRHVSTTSMQRRTAKAARQGHLEPDEN